MRIDSPLAAEHADAIRAAERLYWEGPIEAAFQEYLRLSEIGLSECQVFVGWMYETGKGVRPDLERARHWYGRASLSGMPAAKFRLGALSESAGLIEDAVRHYRDAATSRYAPALSRLGTMYFYGRGVVADKAEGKRLLRLAHKSGSYVAGARLGWLLLQGAEGFAGRIKGVGLLVVCAVRGFVAGLRDPTSESLSD